MGNPLIRCRCAICTVIDTLGKDCVTLNDNLTFAVSLNNKRSFTLFNSRKPNLLGVPANVYTPQS